MFVRRIPYQSVRRRRIHNWLLLLVRDGGAGADHRRVRAAVHQPHATTSAPPGQGARELVVLLDHELQHGLRRPLGAGAGRGRDAASTSSAPADRGSVVLFSSGAEIAVRSTAERERL